MLGSCELWILHSFYWLQNINRHTTNTRVCQVITWAGLSLWFHSSKPVCSKISQINFAVIFGCIVVKLGCRKTVVTSVHLKTLSSFIVRAQKKSFFNWAANGAACFPCFRIVITFIGRYVLDPPEMVTQSQKNAMALKTFANYCQKYLFSGVQNFPNSTSSVQWPQQIWLILQSILGIFPQFLLIFLCTCFAHWYARCSLATTLNGATRPNFGHRF